MNGVGTSGDTKFARLRTAQRIWAVAAIHGQAERLGRLHDRIAARFGEGDAIVYLGNYVGHGSAVKATLDELLGFRLRVLARPHGFACDVVFLRGAQEEIWQKLLQLQFASNPGEVLTWMVQAGIEATIRDYGGELRQGFAAARDGPRTITRWTTGLRNAMNAAPGHTALFAALRHAAIGEKLLFVHAGIDPSRRRRRSGSASPTATRRRSRPRPKKACSALPMPRAGRSASKAGLRTCRCASRTVSPG